MKRILLVLATMLGAVLVASGVAVAAVEAFSNSSHLRV
jgi:hypothetical protein